MNPKISFKRPLLNTTVGEMNRKMEEEERSRDWKRGRRGRTDEMKLKMGFDGEGLR